MKLLLYLAMPLMASGQSALGPVAGHLSINKGKIRSGELLEIRFEAVNRGREPIEITSGPPETLMCGAFRVKISGNGVTLELPPPLKGPYIVGSCLYGGQDVAPGHKYTESFWIGRNGELSRPGKYNIDVTYRLVYDKARTLSNRNSPSESFHKQFELTVEPAAHTGHKFEQ